mmetsp:Transcript_1369/g.2814  ORF Transcript_1369/g.2814 Transcript_1369/m.2814 type:complete len:316 (+) Transcript_1369:901-1848(+)
MRSQFEPLRLRVLRSSQSDAAQLDEELLGLFKDYLNACLGTFHSGFMSSNYAEILLALKTIIFGLTVAQGQPTPGMSLLNLRYRDERSASSGKIRAISTGQRTLLYVGSILLPYVWGRVSSRMVRQIDLNTSLRAARIPFLCTPGRFWKSMQRIESLWTLLEALNFVIYLRHGTYRRLLERCVGARVVYSHVGASRQISFDYLNRQLIWSEISDFVLFLLPLLNLSSASQVLSRYLPMNTLIVRRGLAHPDGDSYCPICRTKSQSPLYCRVMPCGHEYCYYCIASRIAQRRGYTCLLCSQNVRSVRMLHSKNESF